MQSKPTQNNHYVYFPIVEIRNINNHKTCYDGHIKLTKVLGLQSPLAEFH